jgi:hypothetical protein
VHQGSNRSAARRSPGGELMLRAIDRHTLSSKQRKQVKAFLAAHSCKGAKCAECGSIFTVDSGDGKKVAIFPNGVGGISLYVLCNTCGVDYEKRGTAAIPNAWKDSRITAAMSQYAPKGKAPVWIH